jgi:hypothetical protein
MKSCIKENMIVPQLLYLPDVHFNPADGAGIGEARPGKAIAS